MQIIQIKEKSAWDEFIFKLADKTFLQSWGWGEFQERMGHKTARFGLLEGEKILALASVSKIKAKRGTFLLIQHGPAVLPGAGKKEILSFFIKELKKIGRKQGAAFIRMNPLLERNSENERIFRELGAKESPMHASAYEATWKLDITQPEEDILKRMRKTTRYLIRQASANPDIKIEKSEDPADIAKYQRLAEEVAGRQKFVPFSGNYVKNEFEVFLKNKEALLLFGTYRGEVAAAALVVFWSGIGFYHQAASSAKFQKFSIPYLLQWTAVKEAKSRGCKLYDFWGFVDPKENPKHPWAGPTLFKMGFGGKSYVYIKTRDFPISLKYYFTYIFEKFRKIKRSL